jgi:hypothetical protein
MNHGRPALQVQIVNYHLPDDAGFGNWALKCLEP